MTVFIGLCKISQYLFFSCSYPGDQCDDCSNDERAESFYSNQYVEKLSLKRGFQENLFQFLEGSLFSLRKLAHAIYRDF